MDNIKATLRLVKPIDNNVIELKEARKSAYRHIKIVKKNLDRIINAYIGSLNIDELKGGHKPIIIALKNLSNRYMHDDAVFTEMDVEMLVTIIQLSLDNRLVSEFSKHDSVVETVIQAFKLDEHVVRYSYFPDF